MPNALSTDLYEIAMAAAYSDGHDVEAAAFELTVRSLPPDRGYLVAAGLEPALDYLEQLRFTPAEVDYLRSVPGLRAVSETFFDEVLPSLRFTGEVWAVPEGTPVFPHEPLLRVSGPLVEAQIVETALLSTLLFQTSVATRAARVVEAAGGRPVFEFGARRAHGTDAALLAARAAYVGGCDGTSLVEAGQRYGIPLSGTMAHSWVMSFASETEAFARYMDRYGEQAVLLIDTYSATDAVDKIVAAGLRPAAVRIDSGDLVAESRAVRRQLDAAGLSGTRILASGDLDEHRVASIVAADAPIDGFGVGTAISTSSDAPALGGVYKLVEIVRGGAPVPTLKLSRGKTTYPGVKQMWRVREDGHARFDLLGHHTDTPPEGGEPLLTRVMVEGRRTRMPPPLDEIRVNARGRLAELPATTRRLDDAETYRVVVSASLHQLQDDLGRARGLGQAPGVVDGA